MTTGRINLVALSMTPARMIRPELVGGQNTHDRRPIWAKNACLGIRIYNVEACRHSVQHPRAWPKAIAQVACTYGGTRVGNGPSPNGPPDTLTGHRAKVHLFRVQALPSRGMQHRKSSFCPKLACPWISLWRWSSADGSLLKQGARQRKRNKGHLRAPTCRWWEAPRMSARLWHINERNNKGGIPTSTAGREG